MEQKNEAYHIYFEGEINAIVMEWDGYATSEQFKEGTELMLHLLSKNKTVKVLADIKDMVLIGMEDQRWLDSNFLPRAIAAGFRFLAIVRPDNYFNKVAAESISYKVDQEKLAISFFDNVADAREWLLSV